MDSHNWGSEHEFVTAFQAVQKSVNQTARDKGWHQSQLRELVNKFGGANEDKELQNLEDGRRIALIHSEASEALENLRHGFPPDDKIPEFTGMEAELADVIIRVMDFAEQRGFRVAEAVIAKAAYNKTRTFRHGGKTC